MRVRAYIAPFDNLGNYRDYIEVTSDVDKSIGSITSKLDVNDYDIGTYRPSDISLRLKNEKGSYSNIGGLTTIFKYNRNRSLVKITYDLNNDDLECGFVVCNDGVLGEEITVFEGLLSDETASEGLNDKKIDFKVLSFESLFNQNIVDISFLTNGDTAKNAIYKALFNSPLTDLLTVDINNINPSNDVVINDFSSLENKTIDEFLKNILTVSNSVLIIKNRTIYVKNRETTAENKKVFYGQASDNGIEDVVNIGKIDSGIKRTINFLTWNDSSVVSKNIFSVEKYGARQKQLGLETITSDITKQNILDNILSEFAFPKKELTLTTIINYDIFNLNIFDKVSIDYPTPLFVSAGDSFPLFGVSVFGVARFSYAEYSTVLLPDQFFKIIGIKINLDQNTIDFTLRGI